MVSLMGQDEVGGNKGQSIAGRKMRGGETGSARIQRTPMASVYQKGAKPDIQERLVTQETGRHLQRSQSSHAIFVWYELSCELLCTGSSPVQHMGVYMKRAPARLES